MELTIQAIDKEFRMKEVLVPFRERAEGSASKLRTIRDGIRILRLLPGSLPRLQALQFLWFHFRPDSNSWFGRGLAANLRVYDNPVGGQISPGHPRRCTLQPRRFHLLHGIDPRVQPAASTRGIPSRTKEVQSSA